ncbi:UDP-N-acetylglucosamine--N-acetylmuramyl-(pentapeptide) pyrophosphoryl-undecaprenol N-acetylglucosamine transferase [Candidatus Wolfebacteria bacterium]|nr:UDP-N-acetylglucosamine--N-acetylmuramyl-(pentapeptide) pyrophosphoryl-undecaprenol N-acetylglucosamine transferase [Candidatus Wolfebacteria bacterium]
MRILLTGGGTGGHIYPLLAVAEELEIIAREKGIDLEVRYLGAPAEFAHLLEEKNIPVARILGSKWRRYFDLRNFIDIPKFFVSFLQALCKVLFFMPDVLFSKGGPGSLPVVWAARFYRIPVLLHDSDSIPGLSNQIAGQYSQRIAISFEYAKQFFSGDVALVGNPIRRSLIEPDVQLAAGGAKEILGFQKGKPLILVMAGSQGSVRINDFILDAANQLIKESQIFHQTGFDNFESVKGEREVVVKDWSEEEKQSYRIVPYLENDYKAALEAADLVISRASSGSIFEIAFFGKPSILIPLPEAAQDHQVKNAYEYARGGAAIVIETDNLTLNIFLAQIRNLLSNPEKLKLMSGAARQFSKPEAGRIIAEEILRLGSKG